MKLQVFAHHVVDGIIEETYNCYHDYLNCSDVGDIIEQFKSTLSDFAFSNLGKNIMRSLGTSDTASAFDYYLQNSCVYASGIYDASAVTAYVKFYKNGGYYNFSTSVSFEL